MPTGLAKVFEEEHPALWSRSTMSEITKQLPSRIFDDAGPRRRRRWRMVSSNPDIMGVGRSCCHDHRHVDALDNLYLPEIIKKKVADVMLTKLRLMDLVELKEFSETEPMGFAADTPDMPRDLSGTTAGQRGGPSVPQLPQELRALSASQLRRLEALVAHLHRDLGHVSSRSMANMRSRIATPSPWQRSTGVRPAIPS